MQPMFFVAFDFITFKCSQYYMSVYNGAMLESTYSGKIQSLNNHKNCEHCSLSTKIVIVYQYIPETVVMEMVLRL